MDCQKLVENASEIAGQNGGQSSKSSYQSPSIRRDMKKLKRFCVKQYKIVKYTIWLILAIQMIPATAAEAFFLPLIIQAILPKPNSNSSSLHPIQTTLLDFHRNFHNIGRTIFTPLKQTPILKPKGNAMENTVPPKFKVKRDIACLYGYSHDKRLCDNAADITQIFLNPLAAIISAAKGPRYEDTEPYEREENRQREKFIIKLQEEIDHLYHLKYPTLPTSYLEAYSTPSPIEITTKYPVHNPDTQWYKTYLKRKEAKLLTIVKPMRSERRAYVEKLNKTQSKIEEEVLNQRRKRSTSRLMNVLLEIMKTFMGVF
jgi:hypothetical protein